jgi:hypothetical protein
MPASASRWTCTRRANATAIMRAPRLATARLVASRSDQRGAHRRHRSPPAARRWTVPTKATLARSRAGPEASRALKLGEGVGEGPRACRASRGRSRRPLGVQAREVPGRAARTGSALGRAAGGNAVARGGPRRAPSSTKPPPGVGRFLARCLGPRGAVCPERGRPYELSPRAGTKGRAGRKSDCIESRTARDM